MVEWEENEHIGDEQNMALYINSGEEEGIWEAHMQFYIIERTMILGFDQDRLEAYAHLAMDRMGKSVE